MGAPSALREVPHDDQESRPISVRELSYRKIHMFGDLKTIWLSKQDDQDAVMALRSPGGESPVRCDKQSFFSLGQFP
jgi:hypothetical protein